MPVLLGVGAEQVVAAGHQPRLERARAWRRSRCAGWRCWPCWCRRRRRRAPRRARRTAVVPASSRAMAAADDAAADDGDVDDVGVGAPRHVVTSLLLCQNRFGQRACQRARCVCGPVGGPLRLVGVARASSRRRASARSSLGLERQPRAGRRAEGGGVRRRVDLDGDLAQVGLRLHQDGGAGQPAVDPQPGQRRAEVVADEVGQLGDLAAMPSSRARTKWPRPGAQRQPGERRRGRRVPPRRGQPGETRARTARRRCSAAARRRALRRLASSPSVDGPPHRGGGRVDLPVEAVRRVLDASRHATEVVRPDAERTGIARRVWASRKAPVPKVHLAVPGVEAGSRRAGRPAGRRSARRPEASAPKTAVLADDLVAGRRSRGSRSPVEAEQAEQLGRPRRPRRGRAAATGWRSRRR